MKTLLMATTVAIAYATSVNALHKNGCDPKDIECLCHMASDLSINSKLLLADLSFDPAQCLMNRDNSKTVVNHTPDNDDRSDDHNDDDHNDDRSDDHNDDDHNDDRSDDHNDDRSDDHNDDDNQG